MLDERAVVADEHDEVRIRAFSKRVMHAIGVGQGKGWGNRPEFEHLRFYGRHDIPSSVLRLLLNVSLPLICGLDHRLQRQIPEHCCLHV
jgi:hypothetical protein